MTDKEIGRAIRAVRLRKRLRQIDVARAAEISQQTVSRIERGALGEVSLPIIRRVADAIDARLVLGLNWQAADLDRLLGARHSGMHEALAGIFSGLPEWVALPEVSFAIYGERGVIDILAWHAPTRSLLVIELKTELADIQATLGTFDRKVRLARAIAKERGWDAKTVSAWLVVADGSTNRRRVAAHSATLRAALPDDGPAVRAWLRQPVAQVRALSFLSASGARHSFAQTVRVATRRSNAAA